VLLMKILASGRDKTTGFTSSRMWHSAPIKPNIIIVRLGVRVNWHLGPTVSGNQSCPEASIVPDLAVRIIRLFEQPSLGFSESNLTFVSLSSVVKGCVLGCNIRKRRI
jgi:hypothetical protein